MIRTVTRRRATLPILPAVGGLLLLLTAVQPAAGQFGRRGAEFGGFVGFLVLDDPTLAAGEQFDPRNGALFGGRVGYITPVHLFFETEVAFSSPGVGRGSLGFEKLDVVMFGASLGYNVRLSTRSQFFLLGGGGIAQWSPKSVGSETDKKLHFGGGFRLFLTPALAIRVDGRDNWLPDGLAFTRRRLTPGLSQAESSQSAHDLQLTAGLSIIPGGRRDDDGDGIGNRSDACPDTPLGARVDERGCALDSDADGVPDFRDRCPDTPRGASVDERGCPTDSDRDGVPDGLDRCPDTPAGAAVDGQGCARDSDGDGVANGLDRCPDTPAGLPVDGSGCPRDGDGDGVFDGRDQCPGTPAGARVDEDGCPLSEVEEALRETGRLVLRNVHFDFNRATLQAESGPILDEVGQALVRAADLRVEIQGHTDAVGDAGYNQGLSERRAQAVRAYLMEHFPSIDPGRLVARGYGETRPVATNRTEEGRRENRRVEFVVLER
ncbi:MAG: OmpA family protein [Gemmatimonadota bacterium]